MTGVNIPQMVTVLGFAIAVESLAEIYGISEHNAEIYVRRHIDAI